MVFYKHKSGWPSLGTCTKLGIWLIDSLWWELDMAASNSYYNHFTTKLKDVLPPLNEDLQGWVWLILAEFDLQITAAISRILSDFQLQYPSVLIVLKGSLKKTV